MGARKTEKDEMTERNVGARLTSCQGWQTHAKTTVIMAPLRMLMYNGKIPARSIPPIAVCKVLAW